jgi:hypothetical protein
LAFDNWTQIDSPRGQKARQARFAEVRARIPVPRLRSRCALTAVDCATHHPKERIIQEKYPHAFRE